MTFRERRPFRPVRASVSGLLIVGLSVVPLLGCGAGSGEEGSEQEMAAQGMDPVALGPKDGHDLPPTDLERVAVGTMAPDFSLRTLDGEILTLSDFRGAKDVVLVVYRGHW